MKPALFSVLCEIKEKTGMFLLILNYFYSVSVDLKLFHIFLVMQNVFYGFNK